MFKGLPTTIKIGAYDWHVIFMDDDEALCGQCDFEAHALRLWPKNLTSPNHAAGILLHECLHVIYDNENLVKQKKNKEAREEQIVQAFEIGLVALFRDNPQLLSWWKKCLK